MIGSFSLPATPLPRTSQSNTHTDTHISSPRLFLAYLSIIATCSLLRLPSLLPFQSLSLTLSLLSVFKVNSFFSIFHAFSVYFYPLYLVPACLNILKWQKCLTGCVFVEVMDCVRERQLSVQDSIRVDLERLRGTLTLKAEESSGAFGLYRIHCLLSQILFWSERHLEGLTHKNWSFKQSLIAFESPWFCLMSCLFLLGGRLMRKTTLRDTVKTGKQPNNIDLFIWRWCVSAVSSCLPQTSVSHCCN